MAFLNNKFNNTMAETKFTSYDEVLKSGLIGDILYLVISDKEKSKTYKDLLALDGGTVGIVGFAVGGLEVLYKNMNTQTYFGKTEKEMIDGYSTNCRPPGKSGNDDGWGCYSQKFWYDGMKLFLDSSESKSIQEKAWSAKIKQEIEDVIKKGWVTKRQIAIALVMGNSLGYGGMKSIADSNKWDAEKTLQVYASKNEQNEKRRKLIDENFPFVNKVEEKKDSDITLAAQQQPVITNGPDFPEDKVFTFNVENSKFLVNAEIGTFSVVPINPEFDFEQDFDQVPLDDEYYEEEFLGEEELAQELKQEKYIEQELDKNLKEEDKIGSDTPTKGKAVLGNDADFWALVAICSLEDSDDQARSDIAQSIYNRLGSGVYGKSLKAIITAKWQYEPAFQKGSKDGTISQEWKNINSKDTAVTAIAYTKGWSRDLAASKLKESYNAIKKVTNQESAQKFIAGRTDFLSENQGTADKRNKSKPARKAVMRDTNRANNVFAWNYNYKKNTVYDPPEQSWFNSFSSKIG